MGQQGQGPGLVGGPGRPAFRGVRREVAEQQLDQAVLHGEPGQAGWLDDGAAHLVPGHRHHHDLALLERPGQLRVPERAVVEVRPQGGHHHGRAGQRADGRDEALLLRLVPARREYFLKLIHHDQQPGITAVGSEPGRQAGHLAGVAAQDRLDAAGVGEDRRVSGIKLGGIPPGVQEGQLAGQLAKRRGARGEER